MDNLEIFDKDGNPLSVADVIYNFIKDRAEKTNRDIEKVYVGVDVGFPKGKPIWVYTTESVDNGYDALDLNEFGDPIKTTDKDKTNLNQTDFVDCCEKYFGMKKGL